MQTSGSEPLLLTSKSPIIPTYSFFSNRAEKVFLLNRYTKNKTLAKRSQITAFLTFTLLAQPKECEILHFEMSLKKYTVDDSWIEPTLDQIRPILDNDNPPESYAECKHCNYVSQLSDATTD